MSGRQAPGATVAAGAFYMCMAGVHIGLVGADAQVYETFADGSPWGWVRTGWSEIFMAAPERWGLVAAALEVTLGVLLLLGGRPARLGWVGILAFQVALVPFGWWFLAWSIPALAVLGAGARHDWERLGPPTPALSEPPTSAPTARSCTRSG